MIRLLKIYLSVQITLLFFVGELIPQINNQKYWSDVKETEITETGIRLIIPIEYKTLQLDFSSITAFLSSAPPEEFIKAGHSPFVLELPLPDGRFSSFRVVESPIMASELAMKYPEIKTYLGQGIDDPYATTRFDVTPAGFHAIIFSGQGTIYIDPYFHGNTKYYISYYKRNYLPDPSNPFVCEGPIEFDPRIKEQIRSYIESGAPIESGTQLRTYRLAVAATGEYTAFHGGTVALGLAAIVTAMNRVNGVYEREVAIRMNLVDNNHLVVYTNASTDPYSNTNGSAMLTQNINTLNSIIGSANYDIGHVFSTGGGGVAYLGSVCGASKAGGVTGQSSPIGDPFTIDYVAHEMGHQFGGNHTFNGNTGSCSGNRNASTAYEPGSGTTIMAYAGICTGQNIQSNSDDYFHVASFDEIVAFSTTGAGNGCASISSTGNSAPSVNAGVTGLTIPKSTPFVLTGSATDPNGDSLKYCWEEYDLGSAGAPNSPSGNAPIFRSFNPVSSPSRIFPKLSDILNNTQVMGEILPSYGRNLNFRLVARDYRAGGGGVGKGSASFAVSGTAGPFLVTSPNTTVSWAGGSTQTITWDVASTNVSPVSCSNVKISLSTDGGNNWQYVLAASTTNDGSEQVILPSISTSTARVKIEGLNHIFFDVSNTNFSITSSQPAITVVSPNGSETWRIGANHTITWTSSNLTGNVRIELSRNAGSTYETLYANTANDGSESWTVTGATTTQALIRITSIDFPNVSDVSNANFNFVQPTVTVSAPNGGETWRIGSNQLITWSSANMTGNVIVELSRNGGSTYETLFANIADDGTEIWTVTGTVTSQARIRISSTDIPTIFDISDDYFNIVQPTITTLTPNGGEFWEIGNRKTIQWSSNHLPGNVKVELSRNGGVTYETLFENTANDGFEDWSVGSSNSSEAIIRITSIEIPILSDVSDNYFDIVQLIITGNVGVNGAILHYGGQLSVTADINGNYFVPISYNWSGIVTPKKSGYHFEPINRTYTHVVKDSIGEDYIATFSGTSNIVQLKTGWNLISVPVEPDDFTATTLFPSVIPGTFYNFTNGSYSKPTVLKNGEGYWVYCETPGDVVITGFPVTTISVNITNGNRWVLIGSLSDTVPVTALRSDPADAIVQGTIYGYNNGYSLPTQIEPGKAYWLFVNKPCIISLSSIGLK